MKRGAAREYCDGHVTSVITDTTVSSVRQQLGVAPSTERSQPGGCTDSIQSATLCAIVSSWNEQQSASSEGHDSANAQPRDD